ncbi:MAG: hypothetical protein GYB36_07955 [Alphaproteobacteria bacterium]|nr:hypothetical protein [Alphaproteobacteria bacterium]
MKMRTLFLAIAASTLLTAPGAAQAQSPSSVRIGMISGYSVIDNEHLVINSGPRRHYLVTLRRGCWGLRSGTRIGTSFHEHERITMPRTEFILTENGRCPIDMIEEVESLDAARAIVEQRTSPETPDGEASPSDK